MQIIRAHIAPSSYFSPRFKYFISFLVFETVCPNGVCSVDYVLMPSFIRPWRIPQVSSALLKMGIRGVTISDVRGFGAQSGSTEREAGSEFCEDNFVAKVKMEVVISKVQVEAVIEKIIEESRTGEIGDGKILLVPVSEAIRVCTGERGLKTERMTGGRAEMFPSSASAKHWPHPHDSVSHLMYL